METSTFNVKEINYNDKATWDLICSGRTKGVFQLESSLGKSWAKRAKPRNIEELAALVSIIRPGCLKAFVDEKSLTQHYVDRKNGKDSVTYIDLSLEPILKNTQGVLVYQEQSMKIAQAIAGFNLQEADDLRKAIGKKKADLMAKIKKSFIEGASKQKVVSKESAEEIFSWIEKSSRYAFNKSHAVSYAICGYWSAYAKTHFPLEFYCNYLRYSGGKQDPHREVRELVSDAKIHNVFIHPPSISHMNADTEIIDGKIHFGLSNVKSLGKNKIVELSSEVKKAEEFIGKKICDWTWYEFLVCFSKNVTSTAVKALISTGMLSHTRMSRQLMLDEFDTWQKITSKETDWALENYKNWDSLQELLTALSKPKKEGGGVANKNRTEIVSDLVEHLKKPYSSLDDDPEWITRTEENYFGVTLTYSKVDSCDTSRSDTTCKEVVQGKEGPVKLAVTLTDIRKYITKKGKQKGKEMGFLAVEDGTGVLENITVFNEPWENYKNLLYTGNNVLIIGKSVQGERDGVIVDQILEL
tara:strand:- start:467 stop:2044 length:1578 start_codon:yes stop_codon:yes gene_type:complete